MESINIKAYPSDRSQVKAIKTFMKSLKIKFELSKAEDIPYCPEFVDKIKRGQKEIEEGKAIKMSLEDFKNLCK